VIFNNNIITIKKPLTYNKYQLITSNVVIINNFFTKMKKNIFAILALTLISLVPEAKAAGGGGDIKIISL
jgi:hypothetical protein